jgi:hypothetical protein
LPSAVRGAGAVKSGLPSGVLGIPAGWCGGHCAESDGEITARITVMAPRHATAPNGFMFPSNLDFG